MCKHVVLVPIKAFDSTLQKKTCKSALWGRVWTASRRALTLEHLPAYQFACCQWQTGNRPSTSYFIYRWLLFIAVVAVGVASFACQQLPKGYTGQLNYFKWFIYFTNWGFILIAVQAGLAVAVVHRYRAAKSFNIPGEEEESTLPPRARASLLCRAYWLAHVLATDLAFVITLIYWTLVHDPKIHPVSTLNVLVHGCNSVVMVVELAVTSHPVRAAHALYGVGAGMAYGVFSAGYWAAGGTDRVGQPAIYPPLDWNKPEKAFGFVGVCAAVLLMAHALATLLAAVRTRVAVRLNPACAPADRLALPTH